MTLVDGPEESILTGQPVIREQPLSSDELSAETARALTMAIREEEDEERNARWGSVEEKQRFAEVVRCT